MATEEEDFIIPNDPRGQKVKRMDATAANRRRRRLKKELPLPPARYDKEPTTAVKTFTIMAEDVLPPETSQSHSRPSSLVSAKRKPLPSSASTASTGRPATPTEETKHERVLSISDKRRVSSMPTSTSSGSEARCEPKTFAPATKEEKQRRPRLRLETPGLAAGEPRRPRAETSSSIATATTQTLQKARPVIVPTGSGNDNHRHEHREERRKSPVLTSPRQQDRLVEERTSTERYPSPPTRPPPPPPSPTRPSSRSSVTHPSPLRNTTTGREETHPPSRLRNSSTMPAATAPSKREKETEKERMPAAPPRAATDGADGSRRKDTAREGRAESPQRQNNNPTQGRGRGMSKFKEIMDSPVDKDGPRRRVHGSMWSTIAATVDRQEGDSDNKLTEEEYWRKRGGLPTGYVKKFLSLGRESESGAGGKKKGGKK